jgi:hypothetical protein
LYVRRSGRSGRRRGSCPSRAARAPSPELS